MESLEVKLREPFPYVHEQLHPAIPEVKGLTNFICYWRIFVIANIEN